MITGKVNPSEMKLYGNIQSKAHIEGVLYRNIQFLFAVAISFYQFAGQVASAEPAAVGCILQNRRMGHTQ